MSDFGVAKTKLKAGAEWRGTINVTIDGEELTLTCRQLVDPEFEEVMDKINRDELQELREQYDEELLDEYEELRDMDDPSDEQRERLTEIENEMEQSDSSIFDVLSSSTFEGIRLAAIYGVEPDDEDCQEAVRTRAREIEKEYGVRVSSPEDVVEPLNKEWEEQIRNATNFVSFEIGMKVLTETIESEGN